LTQSVVQPTGAPSVPWLPASDVADMQGVNIAVFGYPGSGKTTFAASAQESDLGADVLVVDLDGTAARSLSDRRDVQIAPIKDYDALIKLSEYLRRKTHPFKTLSFDTLTAQQEMALRKVMKASPTPDTPSQPEYGKANQLVSEFVSTWCAEARQKGINVVFNVHAKEERDEAGILSVRMALTPGLLTAVYQRIDTIGFLETSRSAKETKRRLLLHSTNKIVAKHHQPMTGPGRLPTEIVDPTMDVLLRAAKAQVKG